jgi:hypothetical protein
VFVVKDRETTDGADNSRVRERIILSKETREGLANLCQGRVRHAGKANLVAEHQGKNCKEHVAYTNKHTL